LAGEMSAGLAAETLATRPLGVLRAAMAAADAKRLAAAAHAGEPLAALNVGLPGLSIPIVWSASRAGRRSPRWTQNCRFPRPARLLSLAGAATRKPYRNRRHAPPTRASIGENGFPLSRE